MRKDKLKNLINSDKRSRTLLVIHIAAAFGFFLFAFLFFLLGIKLPPCFFHYVTGFYCFTCGATRAANALVHFDFIRSVMLNPVPLLVALFLLVVILFETVGTIKKSQKRFGLGVHFLVAILAVAFVFCLLRNFGIISPPDVF